MQHAPAPRAAGQGPAARAWRLCGTATPFHTLCLLAGLFCPGQALGTAAAQRACRAGEQAQQHHRVLPAGTASWESRTLFLSREPQSWKGISSPASGDRRPRRRPSQGESHPSLLSHSTPTALSPRSCSPLPHHKVAEQGGGARVSALRLAPPREVIQGTCRVSH